MPLARAISKLGIASRTQAIDAILAGRVTVGGRVITEPGHPINPERARIEIDGDATGPAAWRAILLNKPRGVVTTRRDPEGRKTIYGVLGDLGGWMAPVGRLDAATSGVLLLTNDTKFADWLMDPGNGVVRVYRVTVRGRVSEDEGLGLEKGVVDRGETLRAEQVTIRKASARETHLIVRLTEGRNRGDPTDVRGNRPRGDRPGESRDWSTGACRARARRMAGSEPRGDSKCVPRGAGSRYVGPDFSRAIPSSWRG